MYWLLETVIRSFSSSHAGIGLPLGNLTSQLFVNAYMNVFDQFVKHRLQARNYIRYADDFVLFSSDRSWLLRRISEHSIEATLQSYLGLLSHGNTRKLQTVVQNTYWLHKMK